jgi:hypothetical protein
MPELASIDISCVYPHLWVGGAGALAHDLPGFAALALCAREHQPPGDSLRFRGRVIRAPVPDSALDDQEVAIVLRGVRSVTEIVNRRSRVLVTCSAGVNRACLTAALVLANTTRMSDQQILDHLRARRHPNALYNRFFQGMIQKFRRPLS